MGEFVETKCNNCMVLVFFINLYICILDDTKELLNRIMSANNKTRKRDIGSKIVKKNCANMFPKKVCVFTKVYYNTHYNLHKGNELRMKSLHFVLQYNGSKHYSIYKMLKYYYYLLNFF